MTMETREHRGDEVVLAAAFEALRPDRDGRGIVSEPDELSMRRQVRDIIDIFEATQGELEVRSKRHRRVKVGLAAAATAIVGIVAVFLMRQAPSSPRPNAPTTPSAIPAAPAAKSVDTARIPGSRIALLMGDVSVGESDAEIGETITAAQTVKTRSGQTAMTLPTGIGVGLLDNTAVRVLWDGKRRYGISLMQGIALFSVDPFQVRDGFFVDTPAGTVHVKGTLFTVVVSKRDGVFVQLHRGQIVFEKPGEAPIRIVDSGLVPVDNPKRNASPKLSTQVLGQLQALRCIDDGTVFTELFHFECLHEPTRETPMSSARPRAPRMSLKALMGQARTRKSVGDWQGAATSYRTVIRRFPKSNEAKTSRVALARIELRHLHNPKGALAQFSRYLTEHGPLTQEAVFGQAEAYRVMGERQREMGVLRSYLSRYPRGIYAKSAKARLNRLSGE